MNKILYLVFLLVSLLSLVQQTESLPLDLGRATKKILSKLVGTGTYYDVEAGVGSCGLQSSASEFVVAVNVGQMNNGKYKHYSIYLYTKNCFFTGVNPNKNPLCNRQVKIDGPKGKSVMANIVDTCPGCSEGCLDMSTSCKYMNLFLSRQYSDISCSIRRSMWWFRIRCL